MVKPAIYMDPPVGVHNGNLTASQNRLIRGKTYQNLSTVCLIPTRGMIPARVVQNWLSLFAPMNQKFVRFFLTGMEVGDAYNVGIEQVLAHPDLQDWPYILTLEEDNLPPPDGLLKLYESMETYAAVGGLYWTKGEGGQPMCYGSPQGILNFIPQVPQAETVQECNGLGMGFTLFRAELFRDVRVERPWFKTLQEYVPGSGSRSYTQDLFFFEKIRKLGYRVACDARVKVGHLDSTTDIVW